MADEITNLPECGGVAFADVYSKTGVRISVTGRGATTADAIDNLMAGIAYGVDKYHFVTDPTKIERPKPAEVLADVQANGRQRQAKPAPQQAETFPGEETERIQVDRFEVQATAKGQTILKAFGGKWSKYGVTVWPEVAADLYQVDELQVGQEWDAEPGTFATVLLNEKGNPSKVLAFS